MGPDAKKASKYNLRELYVISLILDIVISDVHDKTSFC